MNELKLSVVQQRVLTILQNEQKAMSAYALLEKAKSFELQSPVQIYVFLWHISPRHSMSKSIALFVFDYMLKDKKVTL